MAVDVKKFEDLRQKIEKAQQNADRAKGAMDQLLKRMQDEFGCKTLEEAEKKIKQMKKELDSNESEFEKLLDEFMSKWESRL